jgi:hypothetical protein
MPTLPDIVINITRATKPLTQAGFGMALFLVDKDSHSPKYQEFTEASDVETVFGVDHAASKMASAHFSQTPRPPKLSIYAKETAQSITAALTELYVNHTDWYALAIESHDTDDLKLAGDWVASKKKIFIGTTNNINAGSSRNIDREAFLIHTTGQALDSAIALCNSLFDTVNVHFADITEHTNGAQSALTSAVAKDLTTLLARTIEIQDAYVDHDDDAILPSGWAYHIAQGTEYALVDETNPVNINDAIAVLNDIKAKLNLHMQDGVSHTDGDSPLESVDDAAAANIYPDCAWLGRCLPYIPGQITWKWKELAGQVESDFTITELTTIRNNNTQALSSVGGRVFTNEGKMTSGEFIDVIRSQDWVETRMIEDTYKLKLDNLKIPYDDDGIDQIEGVVRSVLKEAAVNGMIAKAVSDEDFKYSDDKIYMFQVTSPTRAETSQSDRAARKLTGVEFAFYLAGAIHEGVVTGLITV